MYGKKESVDGNRAIRLSAPFRHSHQIIGTAAQIFFRYLTQLGVVPLTGTCALQHMKEDLAIFDFELSSEDMKTVSLLLYND